MKIVPDVFLYDGEERPMRPDNHYIWQDGRWMVDLDMAKANTVKAILVSFEAALAAGFTTSLGIKMDAKDTDVAKFKNAYDLAQLSGKATMRIRDYNNDNHDNVPLADALKIMLETGGNYLGLWGLKNELVDQVAAAAMVEAVEAIKWPASS